MQTGLTLMFVNASQPPPHVGTTAHGAMGSRGINGAIKRPTNVSGISTKTLASPRHRVIVETTTNRRSPERRYLPEGSTPKLQPSTPETAPAADKGLAAITLSRASTTRHPATARVIR